MTAAGPDLLPMQKIAFVRLMHRQGRKIKAENYRKACRARGATKHQAWRMTMEEFLKPKPITPDDLATVITTNPPITVLPKVDNPATAPEATQTASSSQQSTPAAPPAGIVSRLPDNFEFKEADFNASKEALWVYSNISRYRKGKVNHKDAPAAGAWGLLETAEKNPTWFYKEIYSRAMKIEAETQTDGSDGADDILGLLDEFRADLDAKKARRA